MGTSEGQGGREGTDDTGSEEEEPQRSCSVRTRVEPRNEHNTGDGPSEKKV